MNPSALEGIVDSYDSSVPAPIFVLGSKGGGNFRRQTLTYAAAIAWEVNSGTQGTVAVTNAVAFDFSAPTLGGVAFSALSAGLRAGLAGLKIRVTVQNTSGGAHGAGTFNALFKTAGNVAAIATGFQRTHEFEWNGTNFVEQFRGAADVAV